LRDCLKAVAAQHEIENVAAGDDADQLASMQDGQSADAMPPQELDRRGERRARLDRDHVVAHDLFDGIGIGELVDRPRPVDHHARRIGVSDVAIGDDADELAVVEHRKLVDAVLGHDPPGDADAVEHFDREHLFSHPL
jgi:hypothetical protein